MNDRLLSKEYVIVSRKWLDDILYKLSNTCGCPFCGSYNLISDKKEGFIPRYGCKDCNRWLTNVELID